MSPMQCKPCGKQAGIKNDSRGTHCIACGGNDWEFIDHLVPPVTPKPEPMRSADEWAENGYNVVNSKNVSNIYQENVANMATCS